MLLSDQIRFVQNDHIGKFYLIGEQVDDASEVIFHVCHIPIHQCFWTTKIFEEIEGIYYRHHRVYVAETR